MKNKLQNIEPTLIPYDDENMEHILAGPDYGQPWGDGWAAGTTFDWYDDEGVNWLLKNDFLISCT